MFPFIMSLGIPIQQKHGNVNITVSNSDGFYCKQVSFSTPFQNGTTVKVFPSLSQVSVAMVTSVDYSSFNVCIMEPSEPSGNVNLNWLAFGDKFLPQGILSGGVSYNMFTSGCSCSDVTFSRVSSGFLEYFHRKTFYEKFTLYKYKYKIFMTLLDFDFDFT